MDCVKLTENILETEAIAWKIQFELVISDENVCFMCILLSSLLFKVAYTVGGARSLSVRHHSSTRN